MKKIFLFFEGLFFYYGGRNIFFRKEFFYFIPIHSIPSHSIYKYFLSDPSKNFFQFKEIYFYLVLFFYLLEKYFFLFRRDYFLSPQFHSFPSHLNFYPHPLPHGIILILLFLFSLFLFYFFFLKIYFYKYFFILYREKLFFSFFSSIPFHFSSRFTSKIVSEKNLANLITHNSFFVLFYNSTD